MPPYATTVARDETDKEVILGLWRRNLDAVPEGKYAWLYESGQGESWVVRDGEEIVGSVGLMRREFWTPRGIVRGAQPIDLNVEARCRTGGAAISMQRSVNGLALEGDLDLLYSFPGRSSECVLRRVGYEAVCPLDRWILPVRGEAVLSGKIRHPAARMLAGMLGDVYFRLRRAAGGLIAGSREQGPTGISDVFDASFDRLWESARPRFDLLGRRDAAYLNWRFAQCPEAAHRVFFSRSEDGSLCGYIVYCVEEGTIHINDFLAADGTAWARLLGAFLHFAIEQEACDRVVAVFIGPDWITSGFRRYGFLHRETDWRLYAFAPCDFRRMDGLSVYDHRVWYLTRADLDTSF